MDNAIQTIGASLEDLSMIAVLTVKSAMQDLASDLVVQAQLKIEIANSTNGVELYRSGTGGFILLAYSEVQGTYRIPHNHGDAWVVYAVVDGQVEMKNYFKVARSGMEPRVILKSRETLRKEDTRIYYPGEIHDTLCVSENALILRFTSCDLREEESQGRMQRFQV